MVSRVFSLEIIKNSLAERYDEILFLEHALPIIQRIDQVNDAAWTSALFSKILGLGFIQGDDLLKIRIPQIG